MLVDVAILLIINFVAVDKTKGVDIFGPGTANVFIENKTLLLLKG